MALGWLFAAIWFGVALWTLIIWGLACAFGEC